MGIGAVDLALGHGRELVASGWRPKALGAPTERSCLDEVTHGMHVLAVGDPQAPLEQFLRVLDHHGLLTEEGWLRKDIHLISLGDHFDYGPFEEREASGTDALRLLSWLAVQSPSNVTLIAGNHDLSRVGELVAFSDESFQAAAQEAAGIYYSKSADHNPEAEFLKRYPALASVELAARDLSTFSVSQRELVAELLVTGHFTLAVSCHGVLCCHAGVTRDYLEPLGLDESSGVTAVAQALNRCLSESVERWDRKQPLDFPGLYRSGSASRGEGGGVLYHRAVHPSVAEQKGGFPSLGRRFDAARLPAGIIQVIGHVNDKKSRTLLGPWVADEPRNPGALRLLRVEQSAGEVNADYRSSLDRLESGPGVAHLIHADGGMRTTPAPDYELLDLQRMKAWRP